jgi:hypothetical protein
MGRILRRLRRLRRSEQSLDPGRPGENTDAAAAAAGGPGRVDPHGGGGHSGAPPNYVPPVDEGRPRH